MTDETLLQAQQHTIELQDALIVRARDLLADCEVKILSQKSAIAEYERVLTAVVGNLSIARSVSAPMADSMIEQTRDMAIRVLRGEPAPPVSAIGGNAIRCVINNASKDSK